ncbi:M48 family metallopeptidase [Chryseobacterium sp. WLY505]|uniref:tetratricopeptide repeat protein n=1 Tax=Chryseobacterium sp. WLY505 TaxID=3068892 RepID=UPI002796BD1B|nr:hypothetical protein [Chryseobacterium sp. WLY505]MDQ1858421.1 hypothetical protein [Chryseobacterium sp. WLY505]
MTRKEFLSLGSLGITSLLIPNFLFSKEKFKHFPPDVNVLLKSASDLRKQKQYNQAKQVYAHIISQFPNEIRAYDGMRKTLLSQKNKEWEVILMFRAALVLKPENIDLKKRLYREYMNASLGNKKIKKLIAFDGNLLTEVKEKYEGLTNINTRGKKNDKQYSKICKMVECNADSENPHRNKALKTYKKENCKKFKDRFALLTSSEVDTKLDTLLAKPSSKDRNQHIRELYSSSCKKHRKEKNNSEALNKAISYYNTVDKNDPLFLKYIRDLSKLQHKYDTLITIETQNHSLKKTFWSALALLDVHIKKTEYQHIALPTLVTSLFSFLETETDTPEKKFEFITRKIKVDILNNQLNSAKDKILKQCRNMYGISNTHTIDRMNMLIAHYYVKGGDIEGKNRILSIVVNPQSFIESSDSLIQSLALINQNRNFAKIIHTQNLQRLISKL